MTLKTVSRHKPSQTAFAYFISIFKHKKRTFWLQPRVSCVTVSNSKISNLVFLLWLHVQFKKYHSLFHVLPRSTALDLSALSLHQLLAQTTWPQNPSVSAWHQAWLLTLTTLLVNYSEMVLASVSRWNKHRPDKTKKNKTKKLLNRCFMIWMQMSFICIFLKVTIKPLHRPFTRMNLNSLHI